METNYLATWLNSPGQQHELNRRVRGNTARINHDNTVWGCPAFCSRFRSGCAPLGLCNCGHAPSPYCTSLVPFYVSQQTVESQCFKSREEMELLLDVDRIPEVDNPKPSKGDKTTQKNWRVTSTSLSVQDRSSKLVETPKHECLVPGCGKTYERLSHLKAHLRWHGNVAPFKCKSSSCGKRFSSLRKLQDHTKIHENRGS